MSILEGLSEKLGFNDIVLRYSADAQSLEGNFEEFNDDFIQRRHVRIMGQTWGDEVDDRSGGLEVESETELGFIEGYVFLFGSALNAGVDLVYEADAHSADLVNAAALLQQLQEDHEVNVELGWTGIYISEMFVRPAYRGHRLGEFAFRRFLDRCDPSTIFATVVQPSSDFFFRNPTKSYDEVKEFTEAERLVAEDPLSKFDRKTGQKRLEAWYRALGFEHAKGRYGADWKGFWMMTHFDECWKTRRPKPRAQTKKKRTAPAESSTALKCH